jgi:hypothetical protein
VGKNRKEKERAVKSGEEQEREGKRRKEQEKERGCCSSEEWIE